MQARKIKGRMLFITSLHAYTPRNLPHYSATKAGQTMVVKELARALGARGGPGCLNRFSASIGGSVCQG
jgi:NAD(P)-dependent dehydrogenase (short-subunit alcohol dehydrogenase family)